MAKKKGAVQKIKMESTAGTGTCYYTKKNTKNHPEKLEANRYDKKLRKHVAFKETKIKK